VAVSCNDGPALVLMNRGGTENYWLLVNTIGTRSNRDGIGAQVRLVSSLGEVQYGFVSTCGSYVSASDKRVHFGLGAAPTVSLLEVTWPSGIVQKLENLRANQVLTVKEPR
jgi:enediyne biosynthesis protein E4